METTCDFKGQKGGNVCVIKLMSIGREKEREGEGGTCAVQHIKLLSLQSPKAEQSERSSKKVSISSETS